MSEIVNKVAKANIIQVDLSNFMTKTTILEFDVKQTLWQEMIIKEDHFRSFIKSFDWSIYQNHTVALFCSIDAIIPAWAFMLITSELLKVNAKVLNGTKEEIKEQLFFDNLSNINISEFKDARVMVKGCSDIPNPYKAYTELTKLLVPVVKSLMFGEPCSAVPVFKKR
ncbi:MAG TPA: DUF2480 family protein [Crocinitomix sp.]|nr:DUF2480 family protein [Crocinitomix sp.]